MNEEIEKQRKYALAVSKGRCEVCGKPLLDGQPQASHRINQSLSSYKRWGTFIINHKLNIGYCCSLECNGKLDITQDPRKCLMLVADIVTYEIKHFDA